MCLGIELGSTRIKAVTVGQDAVPAESGEYVWKSTCDHGVWTYDLEEVWKGLKAAVSCIQNRDRIGALGVSGMCCIWKYGTKI